jgi:hypothetical protein
MRRIVNMCEITESESMERRLDSLAAENDVLRVENAQLDMVWRDVNKERCSLRAEVARLKAELASVRSDMEAAAGELLVPIPAPGTDVAKLLHANVMMRKYRIPELRGRAEIAERERDRLRAACEAAREFLDDSATYGLARLEKGWVLGLIRAALTEDAPSAVD